MKRAVLYLLFGLSVCGVGCGESGRYRVMGTVTFDGQPVPVGSITFLPIGDGDRDRSAGFCRIESGRFDSRAGRSPMEGRHRVLISGYDGVPSTSQIQAGGLEEYNPEGRPLFPMYVSEIEIAKKQGLTLDFDVPKTSAQ